MGLKNASGSLSLDLRIKSELSHGLIFIPYAFISSYSNTRFFISNTFISNAKLKLAKNQANVKQHPEVEILLFENF